MVWRFNHKLRTLPAGKVLRVEVLAPAVIRWSADRWQNPRDAETADTAIGMHVADLQTDGIAEGETVSFTFYWTDAKRWEGVDFVVTVAG
jgi:glucoamylase